MTAQSKCLHIVNQFVSNPDQGSEYKLRFGGAYKAANAAFSEQIRNLFETCATARKNSHSRKDQDVSDALDNIDNISKWRRKYACLPADAKQIIQNWLNEQLAADDVLEQRYAAASFVFASRSTVETVPFIELFPGSRLRCACWLESEKCNKPRLLPLVFALPDEQWRLLADALPFAKSWNSYPAIDDLLDRLGLPAFSRKGNLPRCIAIGLLEREQLQQRDVFAPLMRRLPRGRLDLFNLALGHVSRSYLVWTYMGLLVRDPPAAVAADSSGVVTVPNVSSPTPSVSPPFSLSSCASDVEFEISCSDNELDEPRLVPWFEHLTLQSRRRSF